MAIAEVDGSIFVGSGTDEETGEHTIRLGAIQGDDLMASDGNGFGFQLSVTQAETLIERLRRGIEENISPLNVPAIGAKLAVAVEDEDDYDGIIVILGWPKNLTIVADATDCWVLRWS
jgi:hypothetical protein